MAKFTEWCPERVEALAAPFPKELHAQKDRRGTFVSVHHYVARLNELVGPNGWSMPEPSTYHAGAKLGCAVGITILGVTKWNVGDEMEDHGEPVEYTDDQGKTREKVVDFGSSSTNSWAQAFKRCCAYGFGLGLYLYDKEFTKRYLSERPGANRSAEPERRPAGDQTAKGVVPPVQPQRQPKQGGGLADDKQIKAIAVLYDVHDIPFDLREQVTAEVNSGSLT